MDKNFEGSSLDVNSDLNDLAQQRMGSGIIAGNWNDKIESVRVTSRLVNTVVVVPRNDNPIVRKDDNPDVFKTRLEAYRNQTAPPSAYYESKGMLKTADGMKPIDDVTVAIKGILGR